MAKYTQLTSILSRDPTTDQAFKSPTYYAFKLFATHCRGVALRTFVACDTGSTSEHYSHITHRAAVTPLPFKIRRISDGFSLASSRRRSKS